MQISQTMLNRVRIILTLGVFYALYTYLAPVWGFMFLGYCLLVEIADLQEDVTKLEEDDKKWMSLFTNRRGF